MEIMKLIDEELIFIELSSSNKEDLFKKLSEVLKNKGYVKDTFFEGLLRREKVYPTGINLEKYGCALPHTDLEHVIKPAIAIGTLKDPISFQDMSNPKEEVNVDVVIMLALNKAEYQIEALKQLSSLLQDNKLIERIVQANSAQEIIEVIKEKEKVKN